MDYHSRMTCLITLLSVLRPLFAHLLRRLNYMFLLKNTESINNSDVSEQIDWLELYCSVWTFGFGGFNELIAVILEFILLIFSSMQFFNNKISWKYLLWMSPRVIKKYNAHCISIWSFTCLKLLNDFRAFSNIFFFGVVCRFHAISCDKNLFMTLFLNNHFRQTFVIIFFLCRYSHHNCWAFACWNFVIIENYFPRFLKASKMKCGKLSKIRIYEHFTL